MKTIHRMFFSFFDEKRWLDKMNEDGFELMRASLFTYVFEKTDKRVRYEYIPLRRGRKSFLALDYKNKDKDVKAVYGKSDMALFKKPADKGAPSVMTAGEKRLAFERYKSSLSVYSLVFFALAAMFALLARRADMKLLLIPSVIFIAVAAGELLRSAKARRYIKALS